MRDNPNVAFFFDIRFLSFRFLYICCRLWCVWACTSNYDNIPHWLEENKNFGVPALKHSLLQYMHEKKDRTNINAKKNIDIVQVDDASASFRLFFRMWI